MVFGLSRVEGGMIAGQVTGQLGVTYLLARSVWRQDSRLFVNQKFNSQLRMAKRYLSHPLQIAPAQVIGVGAQQIPVFLINTAYTLASAGYFALAYRLVSLPTTLIANSIGEVYRQRISVAYAERGEFLSDFRAALNKTALIAAPPFALLYFVAPGLFAVIFGEPWRIAGEYARILLIGSFVQFIITPVDKGAVVTGASRYIFYWQLARLCSYLVLSVFAVLLDMALETVLWWFVFCNVALYLVDAVVEFCLAKGQKNGR